jgi:transcription initiation factor TFIID subunit 1
VYTRYPYKHIPHVSSQFKTRLSKQEARSFHRPALQFPANIEIRFSKVRTAKKKKDKSGRKLGKGGNVGESLHKTGDLSLRDTSNFVLWEYSASFNFISWDSF